MVAAGSGRVPVLRDFGHSCELLLCLRGTWPPIVLVVAPGGSTGDVSRFGACRISVYICNGQTRRNFLYTDTVGPHVPKKQYQTRLDSDMAEAVEEYQDEHNLTDAEAVRRLVAAGLEHQSQPTREEIAAHLEEIQSSIRGVRREIDTDDDRGGGGQLERAGQVGTVIAAVTTGVLAAVVVLILGVPF